MLDVPGENLTLFSQEAVPRALHEYLGYLPDVDPSNGTSANHVAGSIVTLARLDAATATTVSFVLEDGSDKVEITYQSFTATQSCQLFIWCTVNWSEV